MLATATANKKDEKGHALDSGLMRIMQTVGSTAGGALTAVFIRYALNQVRIDNKPLLDHVLGQPFAHWWIWAATGGTIALVVSEFRRHRRREQAEALEAWAPTAQLRFAAGLDRSDLGDAFSMDAFAGWYRARNHLTGRHGDSDIEMMDLTTEHVGEDSTTYKHQTVLLLRGAGEGLPDFEVVPASVGLRFMEALGMFGVHIKARDELDTTTVDTVRRFNQAFILFPGGQREVSESRKVGASLPDLSEISPLFRLRVLELLLEYRGWSVECQGNDIAVWKTKRVVPVSDRMALLEAGQRICSLLRKASDADRADPKLEMDFSEPAKPDTTRSIVLLVGGLFGGFFLGGILGMVGFFLLDPPWMFLAFFGGMFGGSALGGFIGWKLSARRR